MIHHLNMIIINITHAKGEHPLNNKSRRIIIFSILTVNYSIEGGNETPETPETSTQGIQRTHLLGLCSREVHE